MSILAEQFDRGFVQIGITINPTRGFDLKSHILKNHSELARVCIPLPKRQWAI